MSFNTSNSPYVNYSSIINCLYFDDFNTFQVLGQKYVKFFGVFLDNFKNQKDILKLTDLQLWQWHTEIEKKFDIIRVSTCKCLDDRNYHLQNVKLLYTRGFSASRFLACTYVFLLINETDMRLVKAKKVEHNN